MTSSGKVPSLSPTIRWSIHIFLAIIANQIHLNFGSPVFTYNPSIAQFQIQSGRNIRHLPCVVRRSGVEGVCMFAIDCIKANGTHLGTCIDRFYFGSCCQLKDESDIADSEIVENSIDQNTIPHFSFGSAITSTTATAFHSSLTSTPRTISSTTKRSSVSKPTSTNTVQHQKLTTINKLVTSSPKPDTTTVKFVPITMVSNAESKTEASNEQSIIEKIPETTVRNVISSKLPATTEENIKLQTFQSVQETTFTTPATISVSSTSTTPKPSRRTSTIPAYPTTPKTTTQSQSQSFGISTIPTVTSTTSIKPRTTTEFSSTQTATEKSTKPASTKPSQTKPTATKSATTKPTTAKQTITIPSSKRPEQTQTISQPTKTTIVKLTNQKITSVKPITVQSTLSTDKQSTIVAHSTAAAIVQTTQPSTTTSTKTKPTSTQKKKKPAVTKPSTATVPTPTTLESTIRPIISRINTTRTTPKPKTTTTTTTTTTTKVTTPIPEFITWSNTEIVKTEYPPEWILIPSVLPLFTTTSQTISSSTPKPDTSSTGYTEATRFPTRKPTESTTEAALTSESIIRPTIQPIFTQSATEQPPTTILVTTEISQQPVTTKLAVAATTATLQTIDTTDNEEVLSTTESFTMFSETEEETTTAPTTTTAAATADNTEIIQMDHILNHTTSALPAYTQSIADTTVKISELNSTPPVSFTESSVTVSTASHSSFVPNNSIPSMTTMHPPILLTTILMPSQEPEYERLPTLKPMSDSLENTTTMATTMSALSTNSHTTVQNQMPFQPISTIAAVATAAATATTESSDKLTTDYNTESISEGITTTIASSNIPLTTFEAYDVENSTVENVTLEFVDLSTTTEAISSTASVMQYLETASYKQVCGKRMYPEPRIVGGSKASFGRWPWQISLRQWRTSTYLHKCGAALLNENWAVTAAHCVDNVPPSDLLLRLGEYDLAEEEEPYLYQERRVQIVASHPQFDPRTFEYDLALLRFYEPVAFQPNIIPVCVPETDENFIGRTAFVTGWGRLYEDGPLPSVLQEVSVPVINNTLCEGMYRNAGYIEHIPHIFICAGWRKGGYDSCEGDSGGPMVIQREDKRFLLAGVISWGIGCAEPNQPGVYTRISEFREWINQILQF